jgi:hypothetical protein
MRTRRKTLSLAVVLAVAVAAPAIAQQSASSYPPACDASKMSKSDVDRAHTVFLSGKQYLEESNYDKAISYFKDAYSIDCSIHAILPIIATAYERKGDRGEAIHALEEYQKRAPSAPDHEVMERRIRNLKDQQAREQPAPVASATASAPAVASSAPAPSAAPSSAGSVAPAASSAPPVPPPSEGGHTAAPWIVVGAGGVAVIVGAIVWASGSGEVSTAERDCPGHTCAPGDSTDVSKGNDGRTLETVGWVAMGVGAAAIAGGLIWHFVEPTSPVASAAAHIVPVLAPASGANGSLAGLSVSGAF